MAYRFDEEVPHFGAKAYMYTRVSTAIQVEGQSLEAQKKAIYAEAEKQGMTIVGEYSDEGKSGKNTKDRPAYTQMMEDIKSRKDGVSFVIVFKLSRFGRNAADTLSGIRTMKLYGTHLIASQEGLDSSKPAGKIMISVLSAMAEIERDNIMVQTQVGRIEKAEAGKFNGGLTPYGYDVFEDQLYIVEDEAEIVRLIFDKYANTDLGPSGVANWLNDMGYKKKAKRPREVDFFTKAFILKVIKNPVYAGHMAWGKTKTVPKKDEPEDTHRIENNDYIIVKNTHEPIVSQELWDAANKKRISMKGKKEKKDPDHAYLLSGLLKCPCCGKTLYGIPMRNSKKRADGTPYPTYYAYMCRPTISDRKKGSDCRFGQIAAAKIDEPLRDILMQLVNSENFGNKLIDIADEQLSMSEAQKQIDVAMDELDRLKAKEQSILNDLDKLDPRSSTYQRHKKRLEASLDAVYVDLDKKEVDLADKCAILESIRQQGLSRESIYESLKVFAKIYDVATDIEKKMLIQNFVREIELYPDKSRKSGCIIKTIHFKFPVNYGGEAVYSLSFDRSSGEVVSPPNQNTFETVVQLHREKK